MWIRRLRLCNHPRENQPADARATDGLRRTGLAATAPRSEPAVAARVAPAGNGPIARVNGVALHESGQFLDPEMLRQRACTELLRQATQQAGLLSEQDLPATDGTTSEAAAAAIEKLLERELQVPDPSEEACRHAWR